MPESDGGWDFDDHPPATRPRPTPPIDLARDVLPRPTSPAISTSHWSVSSGTSGRQSEYDAGSRS